MLCRIATGALVFALSWTPVRELQAQDAPAMEVPVAIQVPLFLKVLTFDRRLDARAGQELVVAIVYQKGNRASTLARDDALRALGAAPKIGGIAIRTYSVDLDHESLPAALGERAARVIYVTPLRGVNIVDIAEAARAARATTITGMPEYIDLGLAVGVRLQGDRPKLLLNLTASRLEGADFSSELLRLAQVTR
jgi:hypothetical protein